MPLRSTLVIAAVAILSVLAVPASAQTGEPESRRGNEGRAVTPQAVGKNCLLPRASFRTTRTRISTRSTDYSDIAGARITFTQTTAGCVIVRYSAESFSHSNAGIDVRAVLDGTTVAAPGPVLWASDHDEDGDGRGFSVYSFDFVFPTVSAGSRLVQMQWRSTISGVPGWMFFRTMIIQHQ